VVNQWLRTLIPPEVRHLADYKQAFVEQTEETKASFERFRQLVLDDASLFEKLGQMRNKRAFITLTQQLGRERGCIFAAADVEDALRLARQTWLERWI
jgi:hypothetical protein